MFLDTKSRNSFLPRAASQSINSLADCRASVSLPRMALPRIALAHHFACLLFSRGAMDFKPGEKFG